MKIIIQLVLAIGIIALCYFTYQSIAKPIRFNKEKDKRYIATINRLKNIRKAQIVYKDVKGTYASHFDTLINFVKFDSLPVIRSIGHIPDHLLDSLTETMAVEAGIITRDTIIISVLDSIFPDNYPIDSIKYVPFTDNDEFSIGTNEVETSSKVKIKVFQASVTNKVLLHGMDKQLVINLSSGEKFPGLKVGDINVANNNAGNWE